MNEQEINDALETLGRVEPGDKLSIAYGKLVIVTSPNRIIRWLSGDGKYISLTYVMNVINNAIFLKIPIDPNVLNSLENMKITYHKSDNMINRLTALQDVIREFYLVLQY